MCGIAGVLSFDNRNFSVSESYLARMSDVLAHRGPDGAGSWISSDGKVGLGHRRLSIIDLSSAADQPMCNEDGSLWIIFNGEIYNHAELRRELERCGGHRWKTDHSDTEVMLHAFEEWGIDCVQRFRGMFAFALWDNHKRELWLVRDRIGIKPLYYSVHHGRITFASEIKALLQDPDQERAVDEEGLYHFLSFLATPPPSTLFRGIRKLPGGVWLRVRDDGSMEQRRYWDVLEQTEPLIGHSEEEIAQRICAELRTSVKLRKVSDVPVGVFLSGGIDSSVNAALFSENHSEPVQTFSIGYDEEYHSYPNELKYARRMAKMVGADHHERILSLQDLIEFLPVMVQLQDEPIADPVCVPLFYVSKLARDHGVIVCQLGEGSDELFCGYPSWKRFLQLQRYGNLPFPRRIKKAGLLGLSLMGYDADRPYEFLRRNAGGLPIFWGGAEGFTETHKQKLLSPRLRQKLHGLSSWDALQPIRERFLRDAWEKSDLAWMTYLDLNLRLPELLLMRVDKMSMGVSLEARVPFLDHKFVELAAGIPAALKMRKGMLKYILKKAVRGIVPDEVIERKKQGFNVPVYEWFAGKLGDVTRRELHSFCQQTDFFDPSEVARVLSSDHRQAWYLLNFALWWKRYISLPQAAPLPEAVV